MNKFSREFGKEGKVTLLTGGERCASLGDGSNERFVVRE